MSPIRWLLPSELREAGEPIVMNAGQVRCNLVACGVPCQAL
jgi:hypothetical protein